MPDDSTFTHIPHGTEELRQDIHDTLARYPKLTVSEVMGVLELVKVDMIDAFKRSKG